MIVTRHALGAERVGRDAGDERRVDSAGEAEHDVREPVLLDVVAQSEAERGVDLRLDRREQLGDRRGSRRPRGAGAVRAGRGGGRASAGAAPAPARRAAGRGCGSRRRAAEAAARSTSHTSSCSRNCAARAIVSPWWSITHRVPVEDELVLAAHETAEGDAGDVVAGALGEHALALDALAGVVGGGGDVDDQRRARQRLLAGRRPRLPDVLADGQPERVPLELDDGAAGPGLEVALLVEDAVVGQVHLPVDRVDRARPRAPRRR